MEIAFVTDKLNISQGGSNYSLELLARTLSNRRNTVRVYTLNYADQNKLPDTTPYEVISPHIKGSSQIVKARSIFKILNDVGDTADIIHIFDPAIIPIGGYYRRQIDDCKIVGRLNSYDVFCSNQNQMTADCYNHCSIGAKFNHADSGILKRTATLPKYLFDTKLTPKLLNQVDGLFALSPAVADVYEAIGVDRERISIVPNFANPTFSKCNLRFNPFEGKSQPIVLYVGRLEQRKGVDILVQSLSHSDKDWRVEIVGDGPYTFEIKKLARELNVSNDVTFHGWVDHRNLATYYDNADCFVHPARWPEPFGRTLLEAMQCACPPVVSDIGGPAWVIGGAGTTFPTENEKELARSIDQVIDHPKRFTDNCRHRVEMFGPERVIDIVEEEYYRLVEE